MRNILRQLLDAEEAGRQTAKAKEATVRELLERARDQAERVAAESREQAAREIADCKLRGDKEVASRQTAIAVETDLELERVRAEAEQFRPQAVAAVVARLLDD